MRLRRWYWCLRRVVPVFLLRMPPDRASPPSRRPGSRRRSGYAVQGNIDPGGVAAADTQASVSNSGTGIGGLQRRHAGEQERHVLCLVNGCNLLCRHIGVRHGVFGAGPGGLMTTVRSMMESGGRFSAYTRRGAHRAITVNSKTQDNLHSEPCNALRNRNGRINIENEVIE